MQRVRGLPILTAAPDVADRARVPHHGFGEITDPGDASVAAWLEWTCDTILQIEPAPAIVTGGTGLYLQALIEGVVSLPPIPDQVRRQTRELFRALGHDAFGEALCRLDPDLAAAGMPLDPQRRMRAYEVKLATGRSLAEWQAEAHAPPDLPAFLGGLVLLPPKDELISAMRERLETMVQRGCLEELRNWRSGPTSASSPLWKAIGVRDFADHLDGKLTLEEAIGRALIATRRYAKRQRTWFRHRLPQLTEVKAFGSALSVEQALAHLEA